jgi:hypothetical protein
LSDCGIPALGIVDADALPTSERPSPVAPSTFTAPALFVRFCFEACLTRGMVASSVSSCENAWQVCALQNRRATGAQGLPQRHTARQKLPFKALGRICCFGISISPSNAMLRLFTGFPDEPSHVTPRGGQPLATRRPRLEARFRDVTRMSPHPAAHPADWQLRPVPAHERHTLGPLQCVASDLRRCLSLVGGLR